MSQEEFVTKHEQSWRRFEIILDAIESKRKKDVMTGVEDFPYLYRQICHHLDLARNRNYGSKLTDKLNTLALRGHQYFYEANSRRGGGLRKLFFLDFPQALRKDWKLFVMSSILFYGPFIFIFVLIHMQPEMVYSVLTVDQVNNIESMYESKLEPSFDDNVKMFGVYVFNNTGIGLRTFGSSMILGVGSIVTLMYNGLFIGAVFAHLHLTGLGDNLFSFVIGHGAFELTAICIAGMAGLKLGLAFLIPKNLKRRESIVVSAKECLPLIYGFVAMFFIAALIEAFWSPAPQIPNAVKYGVGSALWIFIVLYFSLVGRPKRA
jgi:uncharacterized membrane protein SpoIIM required for sporulation